MSLPSSRSLRLWILAVATALAWLILAPAARAQDGGRPDRTGWYSTVWARTAQGWRMIHDHSG